VDLLRAQVEELQRAKRSLDDQVSQSQSACRL
jgi:hypothetical protein